MSHWLISPHLRRARLAFVWILNCFTHEYPATLWTMSCHLMARLRQKRMEVTAVVRGFCGGYQLGTLRLLRVRTSRPRRST
ncbi:hypothetical protein PF005_g30563 [Phytophthora fragariae]|uniref:Peroxisomal membrane protein PEX16 n=1 Tax=Phytophthora fragariae TaxID=53985 RepID=A0A6A3DQP8_9STRA|nr:hypothetical protein PF009_g28951 [Phytophthora fragariae]KAE8978448.1 hypothetical protein PF011_g23238 [Phytophthora fragariae]KAE9065894.1 hypothetical protein PF006_g30357 [Phytophthora fragariae]KAE9070604.1 hypothetical protein PF007_g26885 [Phytophthora fragariae]KAE9076445.1 hypothetical protein PF010_g23896 [Phytophthora fragariae]